MPTLDFIGKSALAAHPPALNARKALVEMYVGQRRFDEQVLQLDAMIAAMAPPTAEVWHSRGQALYHLGKLDAGIFSGRSDSMPRNSDGTNPSNALPSFPATAAARNRSG